MHNKFILIAIILITSIIGFSSGFVITNTLVIHRSSVLAAKAYKQTTLEEVKVIEAQPVQTTPAIGKDEEKKEETQKPLEKKVISCPKPKKEYTDETYLDVGQDVSLEDTSYIPSDLVELGKDISKTSVCIKSEAANALKEMFAAAKKDGYSIIVSSGFRDYYTQKSIVDRETKNGNKNVLIAVAKPGYSEHQLGVAVDLTSKSVAYASAAMKFGDTLDSVWLEEHASEYGFIQSYPRGKESVTGYMYEPWHYRYVGIDNAKEIIKNSQTINEYLKDKNQ